jgi:hypothetical protein
MVESSVPTALSIHQVIGLSLGRKLIVLGAVHSNEMTASKPAQSWHAALPDQTPDPSGRRTAFVAPHAPAV